MAWCVHWRAVRNIVPVLLGQREQVPVRLQPLLYTEYSTDVAHVFVVATLRYRSSNRGTEVGKHDDHPQVSEVTIADVPLSGYSDLTDVLLRPEIGCQ